MRTFDELAALSARDHTIEILEAIGGFDAKLARLRGMTDAEYDHEQLNNLADFRADRDSGGHARY